MPHLPRRAHAIHRADAFVESGIGDVLRPMYAAVDRLDCAQTLRHEWLNARGAVFKFSRRSMEVRVVDAQE